MAHPGYMSSWISAQDSPQRKYSLETLLRQVKLALTKKRIWLDRWPWSVDLHLDRDIVRSGFVCLQVNQR
jgi:hypothetical protein